MSDREPRRGWWNPELFLVLFMVSVLGILVLAIYVLPLNATSDAEALDFRRDLLGLLLAAFGAWIGAGAAYFFGRENLRVATQSILQAGGRTPEEILSATKIGDVPPRPLEWTVLPDTPIGDAVGTLRSKRGYWFVPIVKPDGGLETVLDEEAVWRHIADRASANEAFVDTVARPISDLYAAGGPAAAESRTPFVIVNRDRSVGDAYAAMEASDIRLAIVTDELGKPTGFITTGDIRRVLLRKGGAASR